MRSFLIFILLFLSIVSAAQRAVRVPASFSEKLKLLGLDKIYRASGLGQPTSLRADFNGDGTEDLAVTVVNLTNSKEGIIILHGKTNKYFVFGAGTAFSSGSDDFEWMNKWRLYTKKYTSETTFNKEGDILGSKKVKLKHPGLFVQAFEDGAFKSGGIIVWDEKKYKWIHQGD